MIAKHDPVAAAFIAASRSNEVRGEVNDEAPTTDEGAELTSGRSTGWDVYPTPVGFLILVATAVLAGYIR